MPTPLQAIEGLPNAVQILSGVVTGAQPSAGHLRALRGTGIAAALDLRGPGKPRPFDEVAVAREAGLDYVNVPVTGATMNDDTVERVRAVLREADRRPVFVHCASGARVGAVPLPHLVLDHGLEEEDATGQAVRVGLRGPELRRWGLDYARRHRAPEAP